MFKYKIFNVANEWTSEQIQTFSDKTKKNYEKNMKACQMMFNEEQCEMINGYLNNTVFIKTSKYGGFDKSHISDDTDIIFFNIYSSNAETPLLFDFNTKVNVYVKGVSMDSLLLEEDQFSFIQENSQKMYKKIMKSFYHIDIPINDFGMNDKKLLQNEKKQVKILGSDFSSVPFLYFESCILSFGTEPTLNSLMLVDSSLFYESHSIKVNYFYAPLIKYSSAPYKITIHKQATAVLTDLIKTNASSSFYEIQYYKNGILIYYSDSPDDKVSSLGTEIQYSIAQQIGIIARGLHFNFSCYQNNEYCAKYKVNLTIDDEFSIPTFNLLEEKEKVKINVKSLDFNNDSFIINYDRNKYEIERVDTLNISINEEESYVYKPKDSFDEPSIEPSNELNNDPIVNPPKKDSNIGWIIGIAICAVVIVALIIVIIILVVHNRKNNHKSASAKEGEL